MSTTVFQALFARFFGRNERGEQPFCIVARKSSGYEKEQKIKQDGKNNMQNKARGGVGQAEWKEGEEKP